MLEISSLDWNLRAKEHYEKLEGITEAFLTRRGRGQKHAVHDFLFVYYPFSPTKLRQWIPSITEQLIIENQDLEKYPWLNEQWFKMDGNLLGLKSEWITPSTLKAASFIENLCDTISNRPMRFNCFGLHEWAMVYKASAETIRHQGHKLRLPQNELDSFVASQMICCSHYDAFRFFTEEARPLNKLNPLATTKVEMEQGGCLHANMDLYKWAGRLWPWIGSDFIAKAFFLTLEARVLDMRASPYDLSSMGYLPICIETKEGREQYQKEQQQLALRAMPLRQELSTFCKLLRTYEL